MNDSNSPGVSVAEVQCLIRGELSLRARLGYVSLLLFALAMAAVVASLWLTEPHLPVRTQIAFAVMVGIGLSWTAYATWVLTSRHVLLAGHRIIAARMAVAFTTVFVIGSLSLGLWSSVGRPAYAMTASGAVMLIVAVAMLVSSRRRFAELMLRRRALERELSQQA